MEEKGGVSASGALLLWVVGKLDPKLLVFVGPLFKREDHLLHRAFIQWLFLKQG